MNTNEIDKINKEIEQLNSEQSSLVRKILTLKKERAELLIKDEEERINSATDKEEYLLIKSSLYDINEFAVSFPIKKLYNEELVRFLNTDKVLDWSVPYLFNTTTELLYSVDLYKEIGLDKLNELISKYKDALVARYGNNLGNNIPEGSLLINTNSRLQGDEYICILADNSVCYCVIYQHSSVLSEKMTLEEAYEKLAKKGNDVYGFNE